MECCYTLDNDTDQTDLQMWMLDSVHDVHLHKPVGYVNKHEQVPQLLGHKPLQCPQVNDAGCSAAKDARVQSEMVTSENNSKIWSLQPQSLAQKNSQDGC